MSAHTCGQKPTDEGRIIPQCQGCYEVVEAEGAYLATRVSNERWKKRLSEIILARYNPLNIEDERSVLRAWSDARFLMSAIDGIAKDHEVQANREFRRSREPDENGQVDD